MHEFPINFDTDFRAVQVNGHTYHVRDAVADPANKNSEAIPNAEVASTLKAIELGLNQLRSEIKTQHDRLQSNAVACAIETARILLGSSTELIEQRMKANIIRLLDTESELETVKVYVHPSCCETTTTMVSTEPITAKAVEVLGDAGLIPGDCRVDFGQAGRLASLDSQLRLIKTRFEQLLQEQPIGASE